MYGVRRFSKVTAFLWPVQTPVAFRSLYLEPRRLLDIKLNGLTLEGGRQASFPRFQTLVQIALHPVIHSSYVTDLNREYVTVKQLVSQRPLGLLNLPLLHCPMILLRAGSSRIFSSLTLYLHIHRVSLL